MSDSKKLKLAEKAALFALVASAGAVAWMIIMGITMPFGHNILELQEPMNKFAICLAVLVGAVLLTAIKKSSLQWFYGVIETITGLIYVWFSVDQFVASPKSNWSATAFLFGGMYVVRRGIDNIWDSTKHGEPKSK